MKADTGNSSPGQPVKYKLEHARHLISIKISEILRKPEIMEIYEQLRPGCRLILFRDYLNRYDNKSVRIARSMHEPLAYLSENDASYTLPLLNENNFLYAIVSKVFKRKVEFWADIYVPEFVIPEKLASVSLLCEDSPQQLYSKSEKYTIFCRERKFVFEEMTKSKTTFRFELLFSQNEWKNTLKILQLANILAWEERYEECTGDSGKWTVTVKYGGGKTFCSTGGLIRPEELNIFRDYLENCLYVRNHKGSGSFYTA